MAEKEKGGSPLFKKPAKTKKKTKKTKEKKPKHSHMNCKSNPYAQGVEC